MPEQPALGDATSNRFVVEVDGEQVGWFTEVAGLEVRAQTEQVREGGVNGFVHHLPGPLTWPNLVLTRGVASDDNLLSWFNRTSGESFTASGAVERTTAAVVLVDQDGQRLRSWDLVDAIPVRWTGPRLATESGYPTEELEVAHHGFRATTHG